MTLDLYRKRPGGNSFGRLNRQRPGRFGLSREKEAALDLAGQLLIGYSIEIVIRSGQKLLQLEWLHEKS